MTKKTNNLKSLIFSIRVTSWTGEKQLEWIRRTGCAEDEIVLQLEDFYIATKSHITNEENEEFPEFLEKGIQEIFELFARLLGTEFELWSPTAMTSSEQWETIRNRARLLLEEMKNSPWSEFLED